MLVAQRLKAAALLDRFISKTQRQNEPLQAFWQTKEYEGFEGYIALNIQKQVSSLIKDFKKLDDPKLIVDDYEPLSGLQELELGAWIARNLSPLAEYISEDRVFRLLKQAFVFSVKAQYSRWGLLVKADDYINFDITNPNYLAALKNQANYLLNRSSLDQTTIDYLINYIADAKADGLTIDEIADEVSNQFEDISDRRAAVISRTETAQAMGSANLAAMSENGVQTKHWVVAGASPCAICQGNADDGSVKVGDSFSSGDDSEPAHPNCECYTEADEIDLDSIDIWGGE